MDKDKISRIQLELKKGKPIISYNNDELNYMFKPIGRSLYKNSIGRPRKMIKALPNDRLFCQLCQIHFVRSNRSNHNKTRLHKRLLQVNSNLVKFVMEN